ncbi:MAG: hypothetical protein COA73_14940 [Candidatus Hydrogenedentota bacterium]|nr:MAG: hypothetical protein COA73_14940 [Candidatus Hydrogenedentota bacterium]
MNKIRVAHVITRLCKGGAQENTFQTVRLANRDRYDVDLICGTLTGQEGSLEEEVRASGIQIIRVLALQRQVSLLNEWRAYQQLKTLFHENNYDIVHTHTSKAGILGRKAAYDCNVPVIIHTPHGNIFDGYFSAPVTWIYKNAEKHGAKWSDRLIELTAGGIEEYLAEGIGERKQYTSIFSGIDLSPYDDALARREETRKYIGVSDSHVLIGGVGRLEPVKGFEYFIQAAIKIVETNPDVRFIHAGTGSQEAELKKLAAPLGERFRFLGLRDDIPDVMAALDVLVVPSLNEGMGRVILEAGAAQTAVVASRVGGIPEVIQEGRTGELVEPKDAGALSRAIGSLLQDPDRIREMGLAARDFIVPHYSLDNMVMRIERLYEEVLKEKNSDAGR